MALLASQSKSWLDDRSLIIDLGCKIVLENAELFNLVFDNEWLFCVEAKARKLREWCGFIKHVEVADGELLVDCFGHFESSLLLLADIFALAKLD